MKTTLASTSAQASMSTGKKNLQKFPFDPLFVESFVSLDLFIKLSFKISIRGSDQAHRIPKVTLCSKANNTEVWKVQAAIPTTHSAFTYCWLRLTRCGATQWTLEPVTPPERCICMTLGWRTHHGAWKHGPGFGPKVKPDPRVLGCVCVCLCERERERERVCRRSRALARMCLTFVAFACSL